MYDVKMTGQVPFTEMYCHSLVRDSEGGKKSKLLGNVIDPLDVMGGYYTTNLDPKEIQTAMKFQKASFPDGIPECGKSYTSSLQNFIYIGI